MKKVLVPSALVLAAFSTGAFAGSSYVTGNVQMHTDANPNVTSTLEAGHTFDTGTTVLTEFDGIALGHNDDDHLQDNGLGPSPYITLGVEQHFQLNNNLWAAVGYHHLMNNGETAQYRPLFKIGYNFDNGLYVSNRTRFHFDAQNGSDHTQTRLDNAIGYQLADAPVNLKYNNVYYRNDDSANSMDHEFRVTWTRNGVQPYFEYRNQGNAMGDVNEYGNDAFVFGASFAF